jgi:response regulator RpfG family c-di-GMP phosphodiesterase
VSEAPRPESILFVDPAPEALDGVARLFGSEYRVVTACGTEEALELCRADGPFAVVVTDYGRRGSEFLASLHETWPDTVAMVLTRAVELDVAIEALHAGRIFRFLEKPCPRELLALALHDGIVEHRERRERRARTVRLDFSRQCLEHFNGALESRIHEQARSLLTLHRFVGELGTYDTLRQVAAATAEAASELCDHRAARVELAEDSGGRASTVYTVGEPEGNVPHTIEIVAAGAMLGAIQVDDAGASGRGLTGLQCALLESLAASAAIASRNLVRRRERDEAQHATILAIAKLCEQRDNETGKHLERVSEFSRLIAEGLLEDGWHSETITREWIEALARSAPLHDIGKVGIPDHVLHKPGKLTPEEWEVMKRHAELGAQTLRSVMNGSSSRPANPSGDQPGSQGFLEMSLEIAWCHHERWDGGGYPRGLAGDEIPLSARIVAIADVYDALTTERPYKHPWTHEQAMSWILEGSGSHFDPRAVDAFVQRASEADRIRVRLADEPEDLARMASAALRVAG